MKIWKHNRKHRVDYYFQGESRTKLSLYSKAEGTPLDSNAANITYWSELPEDAISVNEDSVDFIDMDTALELLANVEEQVKAGGTAQLDQAYVSFAFDLCEHETNKLKVENRKLEENLLRRGLDPYQQYSH